MKVLMISITVMAFNLCAFGQNKIMVEHNGEVQSHEIADAVAHDYLVKRKEQSIKKSTVLRSKSKMHIHPIKQSKRMKHMREDLRIDSKEKI